MIMMKIYQIVNTGILDTFQISQKSLQVNHCLYFILIFGHYQIVLITFLYYILKEINMNFDIIALTKLINMINI